MSKTQNIANLKKMESLRKKMDIKMKQQYALAKEITELAKDFKYSRDKKAIFAIDNSIRISASLIADFCARLLVFHDKDLLK